MKQDSTAAKVLCNHKGVYLGWIGLPVDEVMISVVEFAGKSRISVYVDTVRHVFIGVWGQNGRRERIDAQPPSPTVGSRPPE